MNDRKSIITVYGLHADEIEQLMKVSPKSYYVYAECWEDILSVPADIIVANPTTIEKEGIETIVEYFDCIDPIETTLILTESCDALYEIEGIETVQNLFTEANILQTTILKYMRTTARDEDFTRRLELVFLILKHICKFPGLTTKDLAMLVEISEESVKRYIDLIRMAGLEIENNGENWRSEMVIWDF